MPMPRSCGSLGPADWGWGEARTGPLVHLGQESRAHVAPGSLSPGHGPLTGQTVGLWEPQPAFIQLTIF